MGFNSGFKGLILSPHLLLGLAGGRFVTKILIYYIPLRSGWGGIAQLV